MTWKKRYELPKKVTSLDEIKIGDLVYYISICSGNKEYGIIDNIDKYGHVWCHWRETKELAKSPQTSNRGFMPYTKIYLEERA
jgi:hypothetical protein